MLLIGGQKIKKDTSPSLIFLAEKGEYIIKPSPSIPISIISFMIISLILTIPPTLQLWKVTLI